MDGDPWESVMAASLQGSCSSNQCEIPVPTGLLIEVSPIHTKLPEAPPSEPQVNLLDFSPLPIPDAASKPSEPEPEIDNEAAPNPPVAKQADDDDDEDGLLNETPPDLDIGTPPGSPRDPAKLCTGQAELKKSNKLQEVAFDKISEESQNIVNWMQLESDYSFGEQITYKSMFCSGGKSSKTSSLPDISDIVKRYRRISSSLSNTPIGSEEALNIQTPGQAGAGNIKSCLKPQEEPCGSKKPESILMKSGAVASPRVPRPSELERGKRTVTFDDGTPSGEIKKVAVAPRILRLAAAASTAHSSTTCSSKLSNHHPKEKENSKPVARVGPLKAVKPVSSMVKPGLSVGPRVKPLTASGQLAACKHAEVAKVVDRKRRSGSLEPVTAKLKSVTLTSPGKPAGPGARSALTKPVTRPLPRVAGLHMQPRVKK